MTSRAPRRRRIAQRLRPGALPLVRKALLLTGIALGATAFGAWTASASTQQHAFGASAYGTEVLVGKTVVSGRSAAVGLGSGCTSRVGIKDTNTAVSVNARPVLASGTIDTRAMTWATSTGVASRGSAATQHVNLLKGMVRATAIKAVSTTRYNNSTGAFTLSPAGTSLVGLVVDGHHINGTPAANTKMNLPGVGYVMLNQESFRRGGPDPGLTVIGIHLVVTHTNALARAGTQAFISVATSSLSGPAKGLLQGLAFGTSANVGSVVIARRSFPAGLGCLGTNGVTQKNRAASVSIPGVLGSGTITDTAKGTVTATEVYGRTTSTVHHLNLLGGKVTATAIKASVSANGNPPKLGDRSSFVGLVVDGHAETGTPPPNTKMSLPGFGTLWLHRRIETSSGIRVIMIQLVITKKNSAHLPVGATIDVANASVGVS